MKSCGGGDAATLPQSTAEQTSSSIVACLDETLLVLAARAQVAEEAQQAKLLNERAAREARMEDAIVRARIRLEHEERLSWSRRLEQAALAVRPMCHVWPYIA